MVFPQFLQRIRSRNSCLFGCTNFWSDLRLTFPILNLLVFPVLILLGFSWPDSTVPCLMMVTIWTSPLNLSLHLTLASIYRDPNPEDLQISNNIKRLTSKLGTVTSVLNLSVFLYFWASLHVNMHGPVTWTTVLVYTYPAISTLIEVGLRLSYIKLFGPHTFGNALVYLSLCIVFTRILLWWANNAFLIETDIVYIILNNLAKLHNMEFITTVILVDIILTAVFRSPISQ